MAVSGAGPAGGPPHEGQPTMEQWLTRLRMPYTDVHLAARLLAEAGLRRPGDLSAEAAAAALAAVPRLQAKVVLGLPAGAGQRAGKRGRAPDGAAAAPKKPREAGAVPRPPPGPHRNSIPRFVQVNRCACATIEEGNAPAGRPDPAGARQIPFSAGISIPRGNFRPVADAGH